MSNVIDSTGPRGFSLIPPRRPFAGATQSVTPSIFRLPVGDYGLDFSKFKDLAALKRRVTIRGASDSEVQLRQNTLRVYHDTAAPYHSIYWRVPPGDWEMMVVYWGAFEQNSTTGMYRGMFGPFVVDASGNGRGFSYYYTGGSYIWRIANWAYSTTGPNVAAYPAAEGMPSAMLLRKVGSDYYGRTYANGSFSAYTAADNWTTTPAYIGFGRIYTGNAACSSSIARVIVFSGQTCPDLA